MIPVTETEKAVVWVSKFQPYFPSNLGDLTKKEVIALFMSMQANILGARNRFRVLERELEYAREQQKNAEERHKLTCGEAKRARERHTKQLFVLREMVDSFGHYGLSAKFTPERF